MPALGHTGTVAKSAATRRLLALPSIVPTGGAAAAVLRRSSPPLTQPPRVDKFARLFGREQVQWNIVCPGDIHKGRQARRTGRSFPHGGGLRVVDLAATARGCRRAINGHLPNVNSSLFFSLLTLSGQAQDGTGSINLSPLEFASEPDSEVAAPAVAANHAY